MGMKTIFITSFDGVETKNVLRSSIFSTILEDKNTRVVVFVKNEKRAQAHKAEFGDSDRIFYEVVGNISIAGLDRLFQWLKFTMLKTTTTDLRRFIRYKVEGGLFQYWLGLFTNRLLSNRWCLALSRRLDYLLVANHTYDKFFEKYKPDLVFLANIFYEPEVHFLRAAKKHGVKTIGFINSWDKITARCVLRLMPDKFVVFNDLVRDELKYYDLASDKNIFVGGIPQYDIYFDGQSTARDEFCRQIGLDPNKKFIVYAPHGSSYSNSDWDMIDLLYSLNEKGSLGENIEIFVRFHPYDLVSEEEVKKRPNLKFDLSGTHFASKVANYQRGDDWEMDTSQLARLRDTLYHMSLLVCYASSLSIDAAIFDRPVINVNFETRPDSHFRYFREYFKIAHYKKALDAGGIRLVGSPDELAIAAKNYLLNPGLDRDGRKRLIEEQCKFTDGGSGRRIGQFVLDNLAQ